MKAQFGSSIHGVINQRRRVRGPGLGLVGRVPSRGGTSVAVYRSQELEGDEFGQETVDQIRVLELVEGCSLRVEGNSALLPGPPDTTFGWVP